MELKDTACALGLWRYTSEYVTGEVFDRFYSATLSFWQSIDVTATYIGVDGDGFPDKFRKRGGDLEKRLIGTTFSGIRSLSIAANPAGSTSPAYDSFATASIGYSQPNHQLLLSIVINESFVELRSFDYERLIHAMTGLCLWDFGYGFSSKVDKEPELHILGADSGKLSSEESRLLNSWYAAPAETRKAFLRDVYQFNLLNEQQLAARVSENMTLGEFAQREPDCSLARITDYGLHLWQVPDAQLARLRGILSKMNFLID